jgi:hypothetical protein
MPKCLTVGVVHRGISHTGACPAAGGANGGGGQYPWPEHGRGVVKLWPGWPVGVGDGQYLAAGVGSQYPPGGDGSGHVGGCPTARDPSYGFPGVELI